MEWIRKKEIVELSRPARGTRPPRRLARYDNKIVLLDPKNYGENPQDKLGEKVKDRVRELAQFLHDIDPEVNRTLKCRGWYEDDVNDQFYLVFELPVRTVDGQSPSVQSLYDLVGSTFKPSVTARIQLARSLAISLSRVHENGWYHKGIRSDSVVFIQPHSGVSRTLESPRLAGFDFARKDSPNEYSEKPMSVSSSILMTNCPGHTVTNSLLGQIVGRHMPTCIDIQTLCAIQP